jgi:hypothetical protein
MSRTTDEHALTGLAPAAARLGHALGRPVPIAIVSLVVLAGLGWRWADGLPAARQRAARVVLLLSGASAVVGATCIWTRKRMSWE